jgi:glycosyltransferase involved in cell wall biosynthesis
VTVFFLNNYDMPWALDLLRQGEYPAQHLYGVATLLEQDEPVELAGFREASLLRRGSRAAHWVLGDLSQELPVLRRGRAGDVIYAGEPLCVEGLTRLRRMRATRLPVVSVVHQPVPPTRRWSGLLSGLQEVICLSSEVACQLVERHGVPADRVHTLAWGPDLDCPLYRSTGDSGFVSSGKTERAQADLLRAVDGTGLTGVVYTRRQAELPEVAGVEVVAEDTHDDRGGRPGEGKFSFEHVIADLAAAAVVVIPLSRVDQLAGLTELADALALGKPVIMTRNPFIDVDLEALGCGLWVPPGDPIALREALVKVMGDDRLRASMGRRAREVAEEGWNAEAFGRGVGRVLELARS